jgi:4-diphosphocytidyl-2-C-methyl-D-erythritol kinase
VLQTIDWYDVIEITPAGSFEFSTTEGPEDETNLVVRAVRAYEHLTGRPANAKIRLRKNVPIGRGLGGGSADAAVTLMGMARLFKRAMDPAEVAHALSRLGSDVPFFTLGGRCLGVGRGDEVQALADDANYYLVIVDPGIFIPTAEAYSWLTVSSKSNTIEGFRTQSILDHEAEPGNDFEVPVFGRYPLLREIKEELLKLGAFRAALSGSGSAMFGQFLTISQAIYAASALKDRYTVKLTKPLPGAEYFQRIVDE